MRWMFVCAIFLLFLGCEESHEDMEVIYYSPQTSRETLPTPPFAQIDSLVLNLLDEEESNLSSLAKALEHIGKSDKGKLRAIYTWITHHIKYDAALFDRQMYTKPAPEEVLTNRITVCTGFSALAMDLAQRIGLQMKAIKGHSKGLDFNPDRPFEKNGHVWNVARINNGWELVDFTWGQGYSDKKNGVTTSYEKFDEQWFCPEPAAFIATHFPLDENWQLLEKPLSSQEFVKLPAVNPSFFGNNANADLILNQLKRSAEPIVEFFPQYDCELIEAPIFNKLEVEKEYKFVIQTDSALEVQLHELERNRWLDFREDKGIYSLKYTAGSAGATGICITYPAERLYVLLYNSK